MIRQLGPPTFFVSFSSVEHRWKPLIDALKLLKERNIQPMDNEIQEDEIQSLIKNDPVTCVRYYRHRMNALRQLITHDHKYYGELKDYFFVTEFQNRGSQHDHGLLWIKEAPVYGTNTNAEIEDFVDRYLSSDSRILANDLKTIQHHHHTRTCRKKMCIVGSIFRFLQ